MGTSHGFCRYVRYGGILGCIVKLVRDNGVDTAYGYGKAGQLISTNMKTDENKLGETFPAWRAFSRFWARGASWLKGCAALACFAGVLLLQFGCTAPIPAGYAPREGDIVFQSLPHVPLVDAIEGITHSRISHCGMVAKAGDKWVVIEAMGSVKETPLGVWANQGRDPTFVACRLDDSFTDAMPDIVKAARSYLGRPYDAHYSFDDKRIYCSELVFKAIRKTTGRRVGQIKKLGDLDWKPYERFIRSIEKGLPLEREMITPIDLMRAPELSMVYKNP